MENLYRNHHSTEFNMICNYFLYWLQKNKVTWEDPRLLTVDTDFAGITTPPLQKASMMLEPNIIATVRRMIAHLDREGALERPHWIFFHVSRDLFSDRINWGRVVIYIHFAAEFAIALSKYPGGDKNIWIVADWTAEFLENNLSKFAQSEGGWVDGIQQYGVRQELVQKGLKEGKTMRMSTGRKPFTFSNIFECCFSSVTGFWMW